MLECVCSGCMVVGGGAELACVSDAGLPASQGAKGQREGVRGGFEGEGGGLSQRPCGFTVTPWPLGAECTARAHACMHQRACVHKHFQHQSAVVDDSCQRMKQHGCERGRAN